MKIIKANKNHTQSILKISNEQLGAGYIKSLPLSSSKCIPLVAIKEGAVTGFCVGFIFNQNEAKNKIPGIENHLSNFENIGYVAHVATSSGFEGQGVGTSMLKKLIFNMNKLSLNHILMAGWEDKNKVNIKPLADKFGFQEVFKSKNFWHQDSLSKKYSCPSCGLPPCNCSALIFSMNMDKYNKQV